MGRQLQLQLHSEELIVDSFAGGGGASLGIEAALGRSPDIAINHDAEAIAMHAENHPATRHFHSDVWEVDPIKATGGRPVALAWFSPDCTHFSKAKGGKPVKKEIRGLAWVVIRWAKAVKPRVIFLENVEEFRTWGPLRKDGRPNKRLKGRTFKRWWKELEDCGYQIESKVLRGCDFGAPTIRKRLFVIARCDGQPIVWPSPTHGPGTGRPYRTAAECIQWEVPTRSIFGRKRPLAHKTMRRIARGVYRYVLDAAEPFIAPVKSWGGGGNGPRSIREPLRTVTGSKRGEHAIVSPTLIQTSWGERPGQAPRVPGLHKPLGTIMAGGVKHSLVAAYLAKHNGGHEATGTRIPEPVHTITARDQHALVTSHIMKYYGSSACGRPVTEPLGTVTAGGWKFAEVRAFLTKYYGTRTLGQALDEPLHTITGRARFGLVTVDGADYAISDIGMRMLEPRELYRAQGFPDSYSIDFSVRSKPLTKTAQIRMVGNSVCPPLATALVAANVAVEHQLEVAA